MMQVFDMDLSIIIPVYQTEEALLIRCLSSVKDIQGLTKEVILVPDGSDENFGGEKMQKFIAGLPFEVKVCVRPHEGVSAARNHGIDKAKGRWIFFMDADDYISGSSFAKLGHIIKKNNIDLAITDYTIMNNEKAELHHYNRGEYSRADIKSLTAEVLKPQSGMGFVWAKLIRREWLLEKKIIFDRELCVAEDAEFMLKFILSEPRTVYMPVNTYFYCFNPDSAVHKYKEDYALRYVRGMEAIRRDLEKSGKLEIFQDEYDSCVLYHLLLIAVNNSFHPNNPYSGKMKRQMFGKLLEKDIFRESLKNIHLENFSLTRKIALICIRLHLYLAVQFIADVRHRQHGNTRG